VLRFGRTPELALGFQFLPPPAIPKELLLDPVANARAAARLYRVSSGFRPWHGTAYATKGLASLGEQFRILSGYRTPDQWDLRQRLRERQHRRRGLAMSQAPSFHNPAAWSIARPAIPHVECVYTDDLWAMGREVAAVRWEHRTWSVRRRPFDWRWDA
jgi:hypothetical protein